ncbi:serine/threonine-protein kinase [Dactylosporangium sp. NPDC000521]|uniref:serine/threonine-protein kinase n=1 Tax=Dactylosporangium sp. NPDC000521 TaxID=3363975 RepID=UPI0036B7D854
MVEVVLGGRYELRRVLGRGGMAEVWLGFDRRLGRAVAVKVLPEAEAADQVARERFDREARTVARLSHPNIVAIHDVGVDADAHFGGAVSFLVMELVEGGSLADRLAAGPLPPAAAAAVAVQVCDALEAAHAAGVIHRDVKPANILFTGAGTDRVKVCDFGIARVTGAGQAELTASAQVLGTTAFMAPEQITGEPVDARSDVYALGCVVYAMLTGQPPFSGETPMRIAWQHVNQPVVPASRLRPGLPPRADEILATLLAKRPDDRPASAAQARALLQHLGDATAPAATAATAALPAATAATAALPAVPTAAVPAARQPVRATAAVVAPTQSMPVTPAAEAAPAGRRTGIGPIGVALAAVVVLVAVIAITAAIMAGRDDPQSSSGAAPTSSAPAAAPPTSGAAPTSGAPSPARPGDALAAARATVSEQADAGQLSAESARELNKRLAEIERYLAKGDENKAAGKVAELRRKLGEQRKDGKTQQAGYTAVLASLDRLAASLPPPRTEDD